MQRVSLAAMLLVSVFVGSLWAMNGKAVAVVTQRMHWFDWPNQPQNASRLIVSSVANDDVTRCDTILRNGTFWNPTLSFDGKRIAFYRNGAGVSIIDVDGTNLRTVAPNPDWTNWDNFHWLSWPGADGGKWVYYHRACASGCAGQASGEVWKVNVDDTTQKVMVCDYTKVNQAPSGTASVWFNRFQLSADAKYCAISALSASVEVTGYQGGCIPHTFPPQTNSSTGWIDPGLTEPSCVPNTGACDYRGACNTGLSCGGNIFYHFAGGHTGVYAHLWNHEAKTITGWSGYPIGTGGGGGVTLDMYSDIEPVLPAGSLSLGEGLVWPSGSSNSEKVLTVIAIWQYSDSYFRAGGNVVVADWKNKKAFLATHNPNPKVNNGPIPDNALYWIAEPGDFWQQPPAGKAGCYEDVNGQWIAVPGAVTDPSMATRYSRIPSTSTCQGPVAVYNLRGARVGIFSTHALARNLSASHGTCVVTTPDSKRGVAMLLTGK